MSVPGIRILFWVAFSCWQYIDRLLTVGNLSAKRDKKSHFPDIGIYKGPLFQEEPPFLRQTRFEATLLVDVEWPKS